MKKRRTDSWLQAMASGKLAIAMRQNREDNSIEFDTENPESAPHVAGSPTSKDAARKVKSKLSEQQREIRRVVAEHPGITRGQLEDKVSCPPFSARYLHQSVGARVDALRTNGYLYTSGTREFRGRRQERLYSCQPGSDEHQAELTKFPTPPRELRAKLDSIRCLVTDLRRGLLPLDTVLERVLEYASYRIKNSGDGE